MQGTQLITGTVSSMLKISLLSMLKKYQRVNQEKSLFKIKLQAWIFQHSFAKLFQL